MATVYKRRELRPIPEGAELVTHRGRRYATWTDKDTGRKERRPLNAAGDRIIQERPGYVVCYVDHTGKRVRVNTRFPDKDSAEQYGRKLELDAENRRKGMIDTTQERFALEGRRPLAEHLADFWQYLQDKGNGAKYVRETCQHIRWLLAASEAEAVSDLTGPAVMRAIGMLRERKKPASLRTCNKYLTSIKAFSRWLWEHKRTPHDPLCVLKPFNEETDPRHTRRELTPDELRYLLPFVEGHTTPAHNLPGRDRAMVYRLALGTGFRAKELRSLTPASFDLDADPPAVTVTAAYSKRRREECQPIRPDLAELLRPWLAGRPAGVPVFSKLPGATARMLRSDLAAARVKWIEEAKTDAERQRRQRSDFLRYEDSAGRFADFHATRHTYISGIVAGGKASVKTAMELARHSTPNLTIGRYSHARLHDLQGALEALPDLTPTVTVPQAMAATGTDGAPMEGTRGERNGERAAGETCRTCQDRANDGERLPSCENADTGQRDDKDESRNVLPWRDMTKEKPRLADRGERDSEERRRWELNPRWRICNPTPNAAAPEENADSGDAGSATGSAPADGPTRLSPELQAIIDAWPSLPEAIRAGIVAMVWAAGGAAGGAGADHA